MEQSIGTLKMRFPLIGETIRLRPRNAVRIIQACITLHNFLINTGSGVFDDTENGDDQGND